MRPKSCKPSEKTRTPIPALGSSAHAATLLKAIVEQMLHMVSIKVADTRKYLFCNKESEKVLSADAVGKTNFELFEPDVAARIDAQETALLVDGGILFTEGSRVSGPHRPERVMSTKQFVVGDPDGSRFLVTISEDVTERHARPPSSARRSRRPMTPKAPFSPP